MIKNIPFNFYILLNVFLLNPLFSFAQDFRSQKTELSFSLVQFSNRDVGPLEKLSGTGSKNSSNYFAAEIMFISPINRIFSLETGLGYSTQKINIVGAFTGSKASVFRDSIRMNILEVPVLGRIKFLKFLYSNMGPIIHFDFSSRRSTIDKQSGIGLQLGLGGNLFLSNTFSIFLEPNLKCYSLIPFQSNRYPDRIIHQGVKIGAKYTFL